MTKSTPFSDTERLAVPPASQTAPRSVMLAVALVSFASLLLELAMTRLFSVVLFYHFAFFAISVALLGLGSGGVFAHVRRAWLARFETGNLGTALCIANSICIPAVVWIVLHTPVSLQVNWANFGRLTVIYLATAVPFFFTGLLFSVLFARSTGAIPVLYGADLAGGAVACLGVVPLLNTIGAPDVLLSCSVLMAVSAVLWAGDCPINRVARGLALLTVALFAWSHYTHKFDVIYAKGVLRDPQWVEFAKWNAISRIEVNNQDGARYVVIDADATTAIMNVDPAKWGEDQQSSLPTHTGIPAAGGFNWKRNLMAAAPAVANVLRPQGAFAIIGPGGGVDVLRAVANGSPSVTGIEINPIIVNDVMRGKYADYSYHLYERPQVYIHVQDGRSYIRSSQEKYDVVQMTLVDTWASTAAGAFALSENNLYTLEAFREYFDHLKPDGMIAITRWEFREPREALRVVSQAMEALHQMGVNDVSQHFVIVADGNLDEDGRPVLVLVKKTPFTPDEYSKVAAHEAANQNLVWLNPAGGFISRNPAANAQSQSAPGTVSPTRNLPPAANAFARLIASNNPRAFARDYAYNVAPADDSAPFFFFTLKTGHVLRNIAAGTGKGMDWRINLGVVVLGMLFIISLVAVLAFLIVPLALHRSNGDGKKISVPALLYFVAIGFAYILVEVSLIQRFVLFLGHPTYALTVVVFLMLLFSGAGSVAARRWLSGSKRLLPLLGAIAGVIVLLLFLLPALLPAAVGLPFVAKLLISGAVLAPLGFLMGMPFPTGLGLVETVEWAWALNAAASVLGSVMAMIIAIHFGLTATLACAAVAYLLAAGCSRTWQTKPAA
jgi:spermine/spermidine synthase